MNVRLFGRIHDPLHHVRRDEIDPLAVAQDDIAGHHGRAADPDRNVDAGHHQIVDGRWHGAPEVSGHVDRRDALQVADGPVDDKAGAGRFPDVIGEIVPDDAAEGHAARVHDKNVAGLKQVDGGLVCQTPESFRLSFRRGNVRDIGTRRHELQRERPSHQLLARTQDLPVAFVLVRIPAARQPERLLGRHPLHFLQDRIRNLWPAVREAFIRVLRGVLDQLIPVNVNT